MLLAATPAHAISFNFQFQDVGTQDFVKGTLDGLVEGDNFGQGITATVTSSPGGQGVGSGYSFGTNPGNPAFTVTKGKITFADALAKSASNNFLFLGTFNNGGNISELTTINVPTFSYADFSNATTQFTAATPTPVPFEPNPAVGGAILGFCFGAAKLRRNHLAKKRMVSVEA